MKNSIRVKGKICIRRSKNLKSGEVACARCGDWTFVTKLLDKHFNEEYRCSNCKKELKVDEVKPPKVSKPKKQKIGFPENCPHKPFFGCSRASECVGCYYNPDVKIALMVRDPDDDPKTAKVNWFYADKKHAKVCLEMLDDIKQGRGLHKGGTRCHFRYGRKTEKDGDE
jgi:hypothetical protein